jgi:hypothetical protein
VATVRERLAVSKQGSHRFHTERLNPKNLGEIEGKGKYHVEVPKRLVALEDSDAAVERNSAWEII